MAKFLEELAKYIDSENKSGLDECCIVFPSRRAGIYFMNHLAELHPTPAWAPEIRTMGDLVAELSELHTADNLSLVAELYKIYIKHINSKESFDNFYFWGEMLLSDFDDIDKQLVDASDLFQNIADLKNIEADLSYLTETQIEAIKTFWENFEESKNSDEKKNFSNLWRSMFQIYSEFKESIRLKGMAYEGMLYRDLIERIRSGNSPEIPWKNIYIAGFNILNECEKAFFRYLQKKLKVNFFWDYDEMYIQDTEHEAGSFMRENLKEFPSALPPSLFKNLEDKSKKIQIIAESSQTGQAITAGSILEELSKNQEINFKNTAVVLADEGLLMPFIYSIPDSCKDVNITMGMQVTDTPVYSYIEAIMSLSRNSRKYGGKSRYYHRDILTFIRNRYLRDERAKLQPLEEYILSGNRVYLDTSEILDNPVLSRIFPVPDELMEFIAYLRRLLFDLFESLPEKEDDPNPDVSLLEKESVYSVFTTVCRLEEIFLKSGIKLELSTFRVLLRKLLNQQKINFTGEPLQGLQLMGLLETRCLDFENIILLSANEDILPKKSSPHSFIPYNLRKGFGMSTPERQDAMFSYYFYRLIQRSSQVYLLYNSISSGMNKGEMSRYLYQLKYTSPYSIEETSRVYTIGTLHPKQISIDKTGRIWEKLMDYEKKSNSSLSLSPSALCTYLDCSLKFYFRNVAGIRELDEVTEEVDRLAFGEILHEAIAFLYKEYEGKQLTKALLQAMIRNNELIEKIVIHAINKVTNPSNKSKAAEIEGKNLIISEILKKYLKAILRVDESFAPFEIASIEEKVGASFPIITESGPKNIKLGGRIDRTDRISGQLRIIDYKTGGKSKIIKSLVDLTDTEKGYEYHAAFQVLCYSLILSRSTGTRNIQPAIFYLKEIFSENFDPRLSLKDETQPKLDSYETAAIEFEILLSDLLGQIFNPSLPFKQTENIKTCENCEFASVCHRD